jgi:hypothetical protein
MKSNELKQIKRRVFAKKKNSNENHLNWVFFHLLEIKLIKLFILFFCVFFSHPTPAKSFAFELLSSMSNNPFKFWANPAIFANR